MCSFVYESDDIRHVEPSQTCCKRRNVSWNFHPSDFKVTHQQLTEQTQKYVKKKTTCKNQTQMQQLMAQTQEALKTKKAGQTFVAEFRHTSLQERPPLR